MWQQLKQGLKTLSKKRSPDPQVISYQTLRRSIGWLGLSLPLVMVLGSFLFSTCKTVQPSISHYYYTNMREVFVGILCAVALFLFSYRGFSRIDSISSNIAGFFALGIALFPTNLLCVKDTNECYPCEADVISLTNIPFHSTIHLSCAALFFITLSLVSIFLFTKSKHSPQHQTPEKKKRNVVYVVCGIVMLVSIAVIGLHFLLGKKETKLVFVFETTALLAFGVSWLTKGEMILADN